MDRRPPWLTTWLPHPPPVHSRYETPRPGRRNAFTYHMQYFDIDFVCRSLWPRSERLVLCNVIHLPAFGRLSLRKAQGTWPYLPNHTLPPEPDWRIRGCQVHEPVKKTPPAWRTAATGETSVCGPRHVRFATGWPSEPQKSPCTLARSDTTHQVESPTAIGCVAMCGGFQESRSSLPEQSKIAFRSDVAVRTHRLFPSLPVHRRCQDAPPTERCI